MCAGQPSLGQLRYGNQFSASTSTGITFSQQQGQAKVGPRRLSSPGHFSLDASYEEITLTVQCTELFDEAIIHNTIYSHNFEAQCME